MRLKKIHKKSFFNYLKKKNYEISQNFLKLNGQNENIFNSIKIIHNSLKKDNKIFFCGNGGSAADSQHLCSELIGYFLNKNRQSIGAISLNTNTSNITSIANDKSYKVVFSRQLEGLGKAGDVLFAISTSGKSRNILNAIHQAKKMKLKTILLTSEKIKNKKNNIDVIIKVPAHRVDRIQEMHIGVGHIICEIIEKSIK